MNIAAAPWFAKYIGVSTRKKSKPAARQKSRSRERKTAAATPKRSFRKAARATKRIVRTAVVAPHKRSFAELLEAAGAPRQRTAAELPSARPARAMPHPPAPAARVEAPRKHGQLTPAARRIIQLGAEARGQALAPDGIEAQLKRERDEACGIGSVARQIINRTCAEPREAKRLDREMRAQRQRDRDEAFGITPAARAIIDRVEARA